MTVTAYVLGSSAVTTLMVWIIRRYNLLGFEMTPEEERQCMVNLKTKMDVEERTNNLYHEESVKQGH